MVFLDNNMIQSMVINMCHKETSFFLDIYRIMETIEAFSALCSRKRNIGMSNEPIFKIFIKVFLKCHKFILHDKL